MSTATLWSSTLLTTSPMSPVWALSGTLSVFVIVSATTVSAIKSEDFHKTGWLKLVILLLISQSVYLFLLLTFRLLSAIFFRRLPLDGDMVVIHLARTHETVYKNTKWRHQQKLERWKQQTNYTENTTDLSDEQLKKWVVNILQYELKNAETKVLAKGLNYAIAPKQIPKEQYIVATEQACFTLPQTEVESL